MIHDIHLHIMAALIGGLPHPDSPDLNPIELFWGQ